MFDLIPNLLASTISILFPIFTSYKALRTGDPTRIAPWLQYWIVFSLVVLFDNTVGYLLSWVIPFYGTLRLLLLLYLVVPPPTPNACTIYTTHVHPFLAEHEAQLDRSLAHFWARARTFGLDALRNVIRTVQKSVFGRDPGPPPPPPSRYGSTEAYAQAIFSRFNLPTAATAFATVPGYGLRDNPAAASGDMYGLLSAGMGSVARGLGSIGAGISGTVASSGSGLGAGAGAAGNRDAQIDALTRSGALIPTELTTTTERAAYVTEQRERLRVVLGALDKEAAALQQQEQQRGASSPQTPLHVTSTDMKPSKSETSFERIDRDEADSAATVNKSSNSPSNSPQNNKGNSSSGRTTKNGIGGGSGGGWLNWARGAGIQLAKDALQEAQSSGFKGPGPAGNGEMRSRS